MNKESLGKWNNNIFEDGEVLKLKEIIKNKKIVFCTGCYDILQPGHAIFFEQCKNHGEVLVVGLGRDSTISELKGKARPVNNEQNRAYLLASMKDVDYVILNNHEIGAGKIDFNQVIRDLKPSVFVLNNDDSGLTEKQNLCDELGIKLVLVERIVPDFLQATSTTEIISKIERLK